MVMRVEGEGIECFSLSSLKAKLVGIVRFEGCTVNWKGSL